MSKWSYLFLAVAIYGVGLIALGYGVGWCAVPASVTRTGHNANQLYSMILLVSAVAFVVAQGCLFYLLARFGRPEPERATRSTQGIASFNALWILVPVAALGAAELYQLSSWIARRPPQSSPTARVVGRQFEWRMVYPGPDGTLDTIDDIHVPDELHLAKGKRALIELRSVDVRHSLVLPQLGIKRDIVPGRSTTVSLEVQTSTREFQAAHGKLADGRERQFELLCNELCGFGHYTMRGILVVHDTQEELNDWLAERCAEQQEARQ